MQPCPGERSAPHSLVLTARTIHDKSLSFKGPQHAAEITGVNSQATTKLANFGTVVSNLPKQSSLVHWPTTLEKPVTDGTDALRNCSVETADSLNRGFLYFSDHSQRLSPSAGIGSLGTHSLRHTYRSWLDAVVTPIAVQQRMMRHSDIRTTMN